VRRAPAAARPHRHPCGDVRDTIADDWAFWETVTRPLAFGPVVRVDTTGPVDIAAVADWCRSPAPTFCRSRIIY
jgi:hypothetical protein